MDKVAVILNSINHKKYGVMSLCEFYRIQIQQNKDDESYKGTNKLTSR
jgi:hypothetical protein